MRCKIACEERRDPAGQPAAPRLGAYSANVAEGSGGPPLPSWGHKKITIPGVEMHEVLLGKGARALDRMKTPSRHLAPKADEFEMATEDQGS
eukprot:5312328-Pyramimonas_sp.AAC.1